MQCFFAVRLHRRSKRMGFVIRIVCVRVHLTFLLQVLLLSTHWTLWYALYKPGARCFSYHLWYSISWVLMYGILFFPFSSLTACYRIGLPKLSTLRVRLISVSLRQVTQSGMASTRLWYPLFNTPLAFLRQQFDTWEVYWAHTSSATSNTLIFSKKHRKLLIRWHSHGSA